MTQNKQFSFRKTFLGDRAFYTMVLMIAVPIMIQNGITNFVNLLDNVMIGSVGTEPMSGVAIVNQLFFVYNLCIFGGVSGAGIFTAQFYGHGDMEGVRSTFRFKLWLGILLTAGTICLFLLKGDSLIGLFLKGEGDASDAAAILFYGKQYLKIMLWGLPATMLGQVYSSTLRESGETMIPMRAGLIAVLINLLFNYLLIYGNFGFPKMGVVGAALATILSRYIEVGIVMLQSHLHTDRYPYIEGIYHSLLVPSDLVNKIIRKGAPLLINETLWAAGMSMLVQCYSVRGLHVVAAMNISNTIGNVFNIVFIALGDSVAIVVGQLLGAGKMDEARDKDNKMIAFSVMACTAVAVVMFFMAPLFPRLYNTTPDVRDLACNIIMASACFMPQNAFLHACYFTLRSGGRTFITFLFDSVFIWVVSVSSAFILSRFTDLSMLSIYIIIQLLDLFKVTLGFLLVKKGIWLRNIVS